MGLHAVTLMDAQGTEDCAVAILHGLRARYGEGTVTTVRDVDNYEWETATIKIKFLWMGELGSFVYVYKPSDETTTAKP